MEVKPTIDPNIAIYGSILLLTLSCIIFSSNSITYVQASSGINQEPRIMHAATKIYLTNQGQKKVFVTRSDNLIDALREVNIELRSGLVSEPDRFTKLAGGELNVAVKDSTIPIKIREGNIDYQVKTAFSSVKNILLSCNIHLDPKDQVYPDINDLATANSTIVIKRAIPIKITYGEKSFLMQTQAKNVADALQEAKQEFDIPPESIQNDSQATIASGQEIFVSKIEKNEITETQVVDMPVEYSDDWEIMEGESKVLQEGNQGEKTIKYLITLENGQEVNKELVSEEITSQPVPKKIALGKKPVPAPDPVPTGASQVGTASWYDYGSTPTCAHRDYPAGTRLLVINNSTGASVIVTVNDYGPAAWTGRVIDLNSVAFSMIAPLSQGLVEVTVTPI